MASAGGQSNGQRSTGFGDEPDWIEPDAPPRDWKKIVLVIGLGILSWVATYVGMLELIESNMGDLPLMHKAIIGFSVGMLMIMIIWLLDQLFSPIGIVTKTVYIAGYLFLTLISVGFGFGFYWKVLESRSESTRSAESAIGQVQTALHAGTTRLEQLNATLKYLAEMSTAKAQQERDKGTTCPNSRPGDGPRRKLRDDDAQRFTFASQFVSGRIEAVKTEVAALEGDLVKVMSDDVSTKNADDGTRNDFMRTINRRLDLTVTGFNAFRTDPQLRQIRVDLGERADRSVFPTGSGKATFSCPDAQLQAALHGVVRAIDQLPEMRKPQIAAVEGSEATIEAFRRLTATLMGALVLDLPPSAEDLRELQKKAIQSVSGSASSAPVLTEPVGLSKRDYIPLAIAVFVDLCLLLVSIGRPMNRLNTLIPVIREAERGPMGKILTRFNEIHRDPEIRQTFEVFRHVVFDLHGAYYVAVPLDAPYRSNARGQGGFGYGSQDAQDLQHEAHLLANLFSSFEQEKIFARVYNPFLSTKAIQRILFRQGSKFAGCHAFRVYRFRDGQWSKVILNAIMAAAKRAEEEKRRQRRVEDEVETRVAREIDARVEAAVREATQGTAASSRTRTGEPSRGPGPSRRNGIDLGGIELPGPSPMASRRARVVSDDTEDEDDGTLAAFERLRPAIARANGSAAASGAFANGRANGHAARAAASARPPRPEVAENAGHRSPVATVSADDPVLQSAFGRYAGTAAAELGASQTAQREPAALPLEARVANSNTAPAAATLHAADSGARSTPAAGRDAEVAQLPTPRFSVINGAGRASQHFETLTGAEDETRTTVTLTRETATYTVPVGEARLAEQPPAWRLAGQPMIAGQTALAAASEPELAVEAPPARPAQPAALGAAPPIPAVVPPPLPAWALTATTLDAAVIDASVIEDSVEAPEFTALAEPLTRDLAPDPFADLEEDRETDEATVTIAQRLKPRPDGVDV